MFDNLINNKLFFNYLKFIKILLAYISKHYICKIIIMYHNVLIMY